MRQIAAWCVVVWAGLVFPAFAQNTTTRVSMMPTGAQATGDSYAQSVSADGRYVAFASNVSHPKPGGTSIFAEIFVHDRQTQTTERVSVARDGLELDGGSSRPSISADGRFVAFSSAATTLVSGDTNGHADVFVRDCVERTTKRVTMRRWGLVPLDGLQTDGASFNAVISADGQYVVFESVATNLVPGDTNNEHDVFRVNLQTLGTGRVSVSTAGTQANNESASPFVSADGRIVVFQSSASNLDVTGDGNGSVDVFARDMEAGTTTRVSVGSNGLQGNGNSLFARVSGDGRFVAFQSSATNLVPSGAPGVYVHDRQSGGTAALSISSDPSSVSGSPAISADGRLICYEHEVEVVVIDRLTLRKTRANIQSSGDSPNASGHNCALNADATVIAFDSSATNLVAGDTNGRSDVFVRTNAATMTLDRTALTFGAVTSGGAFVSQTAAQTVRLTHESGAGTVTWTAVSSQPWLQVSPASGSGSGALSIGVAPHASLPPSGTVTGTIVVGLAGAANTVPVITVSLTLTPAGTTVGPFGTVDTPTDNRTGVTGAVPFTGWALDDVEVTRVSICRAAFGAEVAPNDPNCGGAAEIFVGFAVFVEGARPDVAGAFQTFPLATRAGWGFMVLTNMLPAQGNGTYTFRARAFDRDGHVFLLGTRTMTCANASATLPFGTIDTPEQGGAPVSGTSFVNFGWALTPLPKTIPTDGSTIRVLVDGIDIGNATYNQMRPDIQAAFPGYNNTNGAVGFRIFDTTALANGVHTIAWRVTDNQGASDGIGSRYFTVSNGVGAVTAAMSSTRAALDLDALQLETVPLAGRRGWDLESPFGLFGAGANGVVVIRSEEVSRIELLLGEGGYSGYLRTATGLAPLPIGSRLDASTNTFTWAPGVGFVGRYDFVFVRSTNGQAVSRRDVRIILQPKGRGAVGPQVVIDIPSAHAIVSGPFMMGGWAVDLDATEGTGVTTLHAWAYPASGGAPIFLGATEYGGKRPDVAAVHGEQFNDSGFGLIAQGLPAGDYDLALFAWSTETMGFVAPKIVRIKVRP